MRSAGCKFRGRPFPEHRNVCRDLCVDCCKTNEKINIVPVEISLALRASCSEPTEPKSVTCVIARMRSHEHSEANQETGSVNCQPIE